MFSMSCMIIKVTGAPKIDVFFEKSPIGLDPFPFLENFIANLRKLTYVYLPKKRNEISKKGGGRQGRLDFFQKNIHIWVDGHP